MNCDPGLKGIQTSLLSDAGLEISNSRCGGIDGTTTQTEFLFEKDCLNGAIISIGTYITGLT